MPDVFAKFKRGTSSALAQEAIEDGAILNPTDKNSILLDQGNTRKEIKTGHTLKNAAGTSLSQRNDLQFGGYLVTTDDSTNAKTLVSDAPIEVEYSVYSQLTPEQKAGKKWLIKNAPGELPVGEHNVMSNSIMSIEIVAE